MSNKGFIDQDSIQELEAKLAIARVLERFTPGGQSRLLVDMLRMLGKLNKEERAILQEVQQ